MARALAALLVIGVLLRLFPILWGSIYFDPDQYGFHADEPRIVRCIEDFPNPLSTNTDFRYPTLLHNTYDVLWAGFKAGMGWTDLPLDMQGLDNQILHRDEPVK